MQSRSSHLPTNQAWIPWTLLVIALISAGGYIFRTPLGAMLELITPPSRTGLSTGGVLQSIRELSNLETVAMNYQIPVREKRDGSRWMLWLDQQRALIIAEGSVTAGVNLDRLTAGDVVVSDDGKVVHITLPAAELLSVNVTKMQTEDIDTGLFGLLPADPTLHDTALTSAQVSMRQLACASNILDYAETNAKRSVERLFALMDGVEVVVTSMPARPCTVFATP